MLMIDDRISVRVHYCDKSRTGVGDIRLLMVVHLGRYRMRKPLRAMHCREKPVDRGNSELRDDIKVASETVRHRPSLLVLHETAARQHCDGYRDDEQRDCMLNRETRLC